MFWPYLAILRQLFTCWNCRTALVPKLRDYIFSILIKMHLFENLTLCLYLHYLLVASVIFVLF
jgi:hypothetical protein